MSISMYDATIPVLLRGLTVTASYLDKAEAYAAERSIDPSVLINARLAPDMQPLSAQVQRISDSAKGAIARLTDIEVPSFADTETTFPELKERVAKTIALLKAVTPKQMEGSESRSTELKFRTVTKTLRGDTFVLHFLLPNVFFHVTTLHDILRHNGMPIGKRDYLGNYD